MKVVLHQKDLRMATNLLLSQQIAFLWKSSYKRFERLVGEREKKKAKACKTLFVHILVAFSFFLQVWKALCEGGSDIVQEGC